MPKVGYEEEKLDKRGAWDPNYVPPEDPAPYDPDPTKPRPWYPNGPISITQPDGIWRPPDVYGKKKIVRFLVRPEVGVGPKGKVVKFGEFVKPSYRSTHLKPLPPEVTGPIDDKYIDPLAPQPKDARDYTHRAPQYTVVPQKCKFEKPGPPTHNRLHKAVASGDRKVSTRLSLNSNTDGCSAIRSIGMPQLPPPSLGFCAKFKSSWHGILFYVRTMLLEDRMKRGSS